MTLSFHKYQGTGNDFIIIDDRLKQFPEDRTEIISSLCHRKTGVGSDGLILLRNHPEFDFTMIFFNPDGSKSLCGNGSRCAVAFARSLGMIGKETTFETTDGIHHAYLEDGTVYFSLHEVDTITTRGEDLFINTGSPHHIRFVDDLDATDILGLGKEVRYSSEYAPAGTNVNFVEKHPSKIRVRTYERGVEDETLSCGTGVTACALAAGSLGYTSPVTVETRGGALFVTFDQVSKTAFKNIYLAGPAKKVFEGTIDLPL